MNGVLDDFIFLLLRLINYPAKLATVYAEQLKKLRFKYPGWESRKKFLLGLVNETGIEIEIAGSTCIIKKILISEKAAKNIQRAIDNYLKKFIAGDLKPMESNYFEFGKQKEYFLNMIREKLATGMNKNILIADSEIEQGYRLFETLLILEQKKYLKIENIYNCQDPKAKDYYKILISANKEKIQPSRIAKIVRESAESVETSSNVIWSDIHIKLQENFDVLINIGGEKHKTNCEKMGFQDKRKPGIVKMKKCWEFFEQLAMANCEIKTGKVSSEKKKELSKRKQELVTILKKFFPSISGDPFEPCENVGGYKIKIHLEPETHYKDEQFRDRRIFDSGADNKKDPYGDIENYHKEQSPSL